VVLSLRACGQKRFPVGKVCAKFCAGFAAVGCLQAKKFGGAVWLLRWLLGVLGLGKACRRCGEFWAKAFVGFGGLGRQKELRRAQNLAKLRLGFGEAKP